VYDKTRWNGFASKNKGEAQEVLRLAVKTLFIAGLIVAASFCAAMPTYAQNAGPQAPPPKFEVKRIPAQPHPGPPPIPEQEIIQKFAANEDVMKKVFDTYSFQESIRLDELTDPGGKFSVTGYMYIKPDGQRYLRVEQPPESTLKLMHFSLEDVRVLSTMPLFPLTSDEIANYTFLYAGQEKLDQLNTYIFQVKPKILSRKKRFFEGVVWIDDADLAIVKSYGKFVSELDGNGTSLPFTMFETYRENFQQKYWLPTYTRSDDYFKNDQNDELPLRLIIHATDFKLTAPAQSPSATIPVHAGTDSPPVKPH
jgi:hypothetical protein